jgi:hypothetical protein
MYLFFVSTQYYELKGDYVRKLYLCDFIISQCKKYSELNKLVSHFSVQTELNFVLADLQENIT